MPRAKLLGKRVQFEQETLPDTFNLLKKRGSLTAPRLAEEKNISRPAAYRRLKGLEEDDRFKDHIAKKLTREGDRGPLSEEFFFV